ncbi:hypothetical protein Glove_34g37 [Diversispora epigaea]|uniref:Uncharacterized protein n=1 Tax=Diversispora epigaea TaxID=1348612 RepID=A0A397JHJ8_9GLOM|nr:hypothetical protein Glove_34g37 [Diversispora epigaea]
MHIIIAHELLVDLPNAEDTRCLEKTRQLMKRGVTYSSQSHDKTFFHMKVYRSAKNDETENTVHPPPPMNLNDLGDRPRYSAYDMFQIYAVRELRRQGESDRFIIRFVINALWRNSSINERAAYLTLAGHINSLLPRIE